MSWPLVKLGEIAPSKPIRANRYSADDLVWQITLDHVEANTGVLLEKNIRPYSEAGSSTHGFDDRYVLYSKLRPYLNKVLLPDEEGVCTTELVPMLPNQKTLDRNYLAHYLKSREFVNWISAQTAGAKMPRVSMDVFWDHEIPLPPLEEQKRIAAILDKADTIRRKRQQAIKLADDFLRSVFLEMFGDPVTNPKGWEVNKFGDVGTLDRGKSKHRPRNDPDLLGGQHPLIQTGDVANSKGYITEYKTTYSDLGLTQSKKWNAGTLCITIAANIAKTGVLTFDACFPDSVVGFLPNELVTVEYIQHWLGFLQKSLEASAPESAQKNINLEILRNLELPIPDSDLQKAFTKLVNKVLEQGERFDLSEKTFEALFLSLSKNAFSGEL